MRVVILIITTALLAGSALEAQTAQGSTQLGQQVQTGADKRDPELASATKLIREFCWRMSTDYGVKITFQDFAENGSREQILAFATVLAKNQDSLDSFCERMARTMNPFYQAKAKKPKPKNQSSPAESGRRGAGGK